MRNAIEYWYPKIKDKVPTPKTKIIPIVWNWDDSKEFLEVTNKYLKKIEKEAQQFSYPLFVRGSDSSIKHSWDKTCFVKHPKDLAQHVVRIVNETQCLDMLGSVPCTSIAIREFIKMDVGFTAFGDGLPINPERRYFINKGKVICHHAYWIKEAIRDPSVASWENILDQMNREKIGEIELLTKYANIIGETFKDYWSVDFCKAKDGKWWCIDMAEGEKSWHPECPYVPLKKETTK